jgi:hypothetical protein
MAEMQVGQRLRDDTIEDLRRRLDEKRADLRQMANSWPQRRSGSQRWRLPWRRR